MISFKGSEKRRICAYYINLIHYSSSFHQKTSTLRILAKHIAMVTVMMGKVGGMGEVHRLSEGARLGARS